MSVSTAAACIALPVCRLRSRHGLHRRISPCSSLKSGFFSSFSDGVDSTRDRSSNAVEAVSIRGGTGRREEEAMKSTQSGEQNHIISTFSLSLIASQLLPSETLAALTPEESNTSSHILNSLLLMDLDPNTAKLAIGVIGPFLSAYGFLFIVRIVMSWYPKLPVGKFPYVLAYAPTEPVLVVTRKVIPPLGGVDVTPVVWFGLLSFLNEILVGPQGLLVLLSQQV